LQRPSTFMLSPVVSQGKYIQSQKLWKSKAESKVSCANEQRPKDC
jgi:hypothetical protein